ncbi:MAG: primosomal protein N' [Candidatus Marinimicrobia bacterium]|nr:primosomal protein N' [Candidatus Neomarinimicrobiota bacterium]
MNNKNYKTVNIAFPLQIDEAYTYKIPIEWDDIPIGCRVVAPLKNKSQVGFVVNSSTDNGNYKGRLKELKSKIDDLSAYSPNMLKFLQWLSDYYLSPMGLVMKAALPAGMGVKKKKIVKLVNEEAMAGKRLSEVMNSILIKLKKKESYSYSHLRNYIGADGLDSALEALTNSGAVITEISYTGFSTANIQKRLTEPDFQMEEILLTNAQSEVYSPIHNSIMNGKADSFLLHGVTGSGKTEIYLKAAWETLSGGGGVLIMVPEIALTPQIASRFEHYFGGQVSILHSNQSDSERRKSWEKVKSSQSKVVVGARSSIFAPVENLKLIIVDEEQEPSYNQSEPEPRYNARDAATMRAKIEGATLILGSATPSMESMYNAKKKKYHYLRLTERFGSAGTPKLHIVNTGTETFEGGYSGEIISSVLRDKISERLKNKEQIILLQNRRGYASLIKCKECGYVQECPDCNVTLTYHSATNRMSCHYCGIRKSVPLNCPECNYNKLMFQGVGTQRVERELGNLFPNAKSIRMDMDTTTGKGSHWRILGDFKAGKYDILIGTQMIAKGLDFDNVTLVGIISADTGLYLPDFRAGERTYQLISQVAGRAGRRKRRGEVVVQTIDPDRLPIKSVEIEEQNNFYRNLFKERKQSDYPPYSKLILFETSSEEKSMAIEGAKTVMAALKRNGGDYELLGPAPAVIEKLRKRYRWRVMVRLNNRGVKRLSGVKILLRKQMNNLRKTLPREVRLSVDVDPVNML